MVCCSYSSACHNYSVNCASANRAGLAGSTLPNHVQRHAVALPTRRACVASPIFARPSRRPSGRQSLQARAGFLSFLLPTRQSTDKSTQAKLVNDLLRIASQTNSGASASQEQRQEIQKLVSSMPVTVAGGRIGSAGFPDPYFRS